MIFYVCAYCGVRKESKRVGRLPIGWYLERRGKRLRKPRVLRGLTVCDWCHATTEPGGSLTW